MKLGNRKTYIFWILLCLGVGGLAGFLSREGTAAFSASAFQPPLSPPGWIFPVVWSILYTLMGISAARISLKGNGRGLNLFIIQLVVNFFWPLLFFNAGAYGFAVLWLAGLWILVLLMILAFRQSDPIAALLQIPYLIWLTFALYLNIGVWYLN